MQLMAQLSETLAAIREHLQAAADDTGTTVLRADTQAEQAEGVRRTQALTALGLVRITRETVDYEVGGTRVATIESAATEAGRELVALLEGGAQEPVEHDAVAERLRVVWLEAELDAAVADGRLRWWRYSHGAGHAYQANGIAGGNLGQRDTRLDAALAAAEYVRGLQKPKPALPDVDGMTREECEVELGSRRWTRLSNPEEMMTAWVRSDHAIHEGHLVSAADSIRGVLRDARALDAEANRG